MAWFVSRKKYAALQEASGKMYREIVAAHRAMDSIDGHAERRTTLGLAHRIRLHHDETRFQQQADAAGKTYTWVCMGDELTSLFADAAVLNVRDPKGGIPDAPTFHQHSVTPKQSE